MAKPEQPVMLEERFAAIPRVEDWTEEQKQIARYVCEGYTASQIADIIDMPVADVLRELRTPKLQSAVALTRMNVRGALEEEHGRMFPHIVADFADRVSCLSQIIASPETAPREKVKAVDLLNRMAGDYVRKQEVTVNHEVSDSMRAVLERVNARGYHGIERDAEAEVLE